MFSFIKTLLFGSLQEVWYVNFKGKPYYDDHVYHDIYISKTFIRGQIPSLCARYPNRLTDRSRSGRDKIIGPFDSYEAAKTYMEFNLKMPGFILSNCYKI